MLVPVSMVQPHQQAHTTQPLPQHQLCLFCLHIAAAFLAPLSVVTLEADAVVVVDADAPAHAHAKMESTLHSASGLQQVICGQRPTPLSMAAAPVGYMAAPSGSVGFGRGKGQGLRQPLQTDQ